MIWREKLILLLATWFRVGYLPHMPGTWGSLAALPLWWVLQPLAPPAYGLVVLLLVVGSIYLSGQAEILLQQQDSPAIVVDEVVGQLIALAGCPVNFYAVVLAVILFRGFDIFKPFPIGLIMLASMAAWELSWMILWPVCMPGLYLLLLLNGCPLECSGIYR